MNTLNKVALGFSLVLAFGTSQAHAASTIEDIVYSDQDSGFFNCAYKLKIASKKCLISVSPIKAKIDPRAKKVFGANEAVAMMTIKWPDGDSSRYMSVNSFEVINLADSKKYSYKTSYDDGGWSLDFSKGLIILDGNDKEHIRLW